MNGTHLRLLFDLDLDDRTVFGFDFALDVFCKIKIPFSFNFPAEKRRNVSQRLRLHERGQKERRTRQG